MKKYLGLIIGSTVLLSLLLVPFLPTFGQVLNEGLADVGTYAGLGSKTLPQVIGNVIKVVLSLLGLIATVILIAGGFMWMTSGGSEEKVKKAKQLMGSAVIGMVIVLLAWTAATFLIGELTGVTSP